MKVIPETANRSDWPRLVAAGVNELDRRAKALEAPELLTLKPGTAPASPDEGTIYYDAALHKLQCWDGTTWQPFW